MGIKDKWSTMSGGQKGGVIAGGVVAAVLLSTAIIVPIALMGNKENDPAFDSLNDNHVNMWVPWSDTSNEYGAFNELVEYYNENNNDNWDVVLTPVGDKPYKESGYSEVSENVKTKLDVGQKGVRNLPDLILNGQDTLSILANYGDDNYTLDFEANGLNVDQMVPELEQTNVAGVDTENGTYAVQLITTQSLGVNLPLLAYFCESDNITTENLTLLDGFTIEEEDRETINDLWTPIVGSDVTYELTDETFTTMKGLKEFGDAILANFEYSSGDISKDGTAGLIGFTNPQTELMTMTQSMGTDVITSTTNGSVYNFLHEGEEAYTNASTVYNTFKDGLESGVYWMPNGENTYSSTQIQNHRMLITVGSTSGLTYNTSTSPELMNADEIVYLSDTSMYEEGGETIYKEQGPSIVGVDHKTDDQEERTEQTVNFLNWFIGSETYAFESGELTPTQAFGAKTGYVTDTVSATVIDNYPEGSTGAELVISQLEDTSATWMAEPSDENTASFWSTVQTEMRVEQEQYLGNKDILSWEEFADEIYSEVQINAWEA